ncbi:MAG: FAD-dependent oxidoreductase [Eubacteriaceae bacterium]|nr:FAD-dependent oxidoreductase [Eubacteriaceae bacterium]
MNIKQYRLNIDGTEVLGLPGQTILEVAVENEIYIPTLCYDERVKLYGSCGMCVCEVEGNPKLVKSCATEIQPNMVIKTNTKRVQESRKTNLELMLSNHKGDCRPPCVLACPAQTDCQGYVGLIANGEYGEALKLVKDKIPLPASLGRVCPHPCEDECRRGLVDEPISIQMLKRFAADHDLTGEDGDIFIPECEKSTGKTVAVIGGGPLGLSAAYFLKQKGHDVTIYEGMPKAGGMLRYGIPEYRLPKEVVDAEVDTIAAMGVDIITNTRIGTDIPFKTIKEDHDAVLLGIGAWVSTGVGCKGEDTDGVMGGIDFLRKTVRNEPVSLGKKVAVVGGGNTAMDACRTAVRLGAEKVYNVYRRTKDEMPADMLEITEAEEEGVVFKNLTNPMEIKAGKDGRVNKMKLQVMELGEPDESGRRRPVPVKGKTETIDVDTVILAIGQAVDAGMVKNIEKTKKGAIAYDTETYMTSMQGVFAGGDCGNDKISIAVEAIADAKKVSSVIDAYLKGEQVKYEQPYLVTREDITEKTFEDRERMCRPDIDQLSPAERKDNFTEVIPDGFDEESAAIEAERCLECGCHDYFECELIALAKQYDVHPERFGGDMNMIEYNDEHPFIVRDPNKCILCGLCVRSCDQLMGIEALGLVNRGFDTVVMPNMEKPLAESGCVSCGQCVSLCPCGALQERQSITKELPVKTECVETTCAYCSVGCTLQLEYKGDLLIKANPDMDGYVNDGLACGKGKFGFDCSVLEGKIEEPMMKDGDGFRFADYHEALMTVAKKAEAVAMRYGKDAVAVSISDRYTNEEAYTIKKLAGIMGARTLCFNSRKSGLAPVVGFDSSPNTIDEICSTDLVLAIGFNAVDNPVIQLKMKRAAQNGAKVIMVNPRSAKQHMDFAEKTWYTKNDVSVIKEIAKALIDNGAKPEGIKGFAALKKDLADITVSKDAAEIAEAYAGAKKAMIVFAQNFVTEEAASMIGNIALLSGHIGTPRDGILQVKAKNNSQGLVDMGITEGASAMEGIKALLCFGEDPLPGDIKGLEFLMVSDTHITETCEKADVIIPGTGFAGTDGTYINTERRMMPVEPAIDEGIVLSNWEIAAELAAIYECDFGFNDPDDISDEMDAEIPAYRYGTIGEILGGVKKPVDPKFAVVGKAKFAAPMPCTDNLMNMIASRLPAMADMTE